MAIIFLLKKNQEKQMPYKERAKTGAERKRKKPVYRVKNPREYDLSLKKRGKLNLYFPPGDVRAQFVNEEPYRKGVSGQQVSYTDAYIELIFTFYVLFGWGMREITGYMEEFWEVRGLSIPVPCHATLSNRFSQLTLNVKQRCRELAQRLEKGESVDIMMDSTEMRFGRASCWYEVKYGKKTDVTPWRKMHLCMDTQGNVHEVAVTSTEVFDSQGMELILPDLLPVAKLFADGTYYCIERNERLLQTGILPVIPPPSHAVVHGNGSTAWHDKIVQYIADKGIYAFHKKYDYGMRSLVEAQFSRIKRYIRSRLLTQKEESQHQEGIIIANILNLWNSFGQASSFKNC